MSLKPVILNQQVSPKISSPVRLAWIWPLLIAALVVVASHRSRLASPGFIPHLDKIVHFHIYGLLATLTCRLGTGWRAAGWAVLAASLFGVSDEWHQSFVPGRSAEFADWLADTLGATLAVTLYAGWPGYRRLLERKLGQPRIENRPALPTLEHR